MKKQLCSRHAKVLASDAVPSELGTVCFHLHKTPQTPPQHFTSEKSTNRTTRRAFFCVCVWVLLQVFVRRTSSYSSRHKENGKGYSFAHKACNHLSCGCQQQVFKFSSHVAAYAAKWTATPSPWRTQLSLTTNANLAAWLLATSH